MSIRSREPGRIDTAPSSVLTRRYGSAPTEYCSVQTSAEAVPARAASRARDTSTRERIRAILQSSVSGCSLQYAGTGVEVAAVGRVGPPGFQAATGVDTRRPRLVGAQLTPKPSGRAAASGGGDSGRLACSLHRPRSPGMEPRTLEDAR